MKRNKIEIKEDYVIIHINSKIYGNLECLVDIGDLDLVKDHCWWVSGRRRLYVGTSISKKSTYLHTTILQTPNGKYGDHINGNTLDNRRSNLRICSNSENMSNQGTPKHNTSGFKGVSFYKRDNNWSAKIKKDNKKIHIGYFDTPEEAALAYNEAAIKYHREFARLNTIKEIK